MKSRLLDFRNKEVINVNNGTRLGYVCDIGIDTTEAKLTYLVIYGRPRLFGLLGKEEDKVIPWENIKTVGDDTILVYYTEGQKKTKKGAWLSQIMKEKNL